MTGCEEAMSVESNIAIWQNQHQSQRKHQISSVNVTLTKYPISMPPNTHLNRQVGTPSSNPFFWNLTRCSASAREMLFPSCGNCGTSCPPAPVSRLARTSSEMGTGSAWRSGGEARRGVRSEGSVAEVAPALLREDMSTAITNVHDDAGRTATPICTRRRGERRLERHRRRQLTRASPRLG